MATLRQEYIQFSALSNGGGGSVSFRTAEYCGRSHLIVPVVALIGDAIIWPMGAKCYELVPARVLSENVEQWNNRPVLPDHPNSDIGANTPEILQAHQFGQIFHTKWANNRLTMEAWLDLTTTNPDAQSVITACQDGQIVEVSVGAWVTIEHASGYKDGKEYGAIWKSIRSDHLAVGLSGSEGACSAAMGCGTRYAKQVTGEMGETMKREAQKEQFKDLRVKNLSGLSSNDLSALLQSALYDIEPSAIYLWVADFDDTDVVYSMSTEERGQSTLYKREYAVVDGDKITLGSSTTEMISRTVYEPKEAKGGKVLSTVPATVDNKKSLLVSMFNRLRSAVFGSDLEAEEAAELIGYQTLSTLFDQLSASLKSAKSTVADLIRAELVESSDILGESAEETLEAAQIASIETMCIAMYGTLNSVMDLCFQLRHDPMGSMGMYKGETEDSKEDGKNRELAGARHSAGDVKIIQEMHDKAVTLGASCDKMETMKSGETEDQSAPCGCHKNLSEGGQGTENPESSEDETMAIGKVEMKDLVGRLLKGAATDADQAMLKEEYPNPLDLFKAVGRLATDAVATEAPETRTAADATPATPGGTPAAPTAEEWLAQAPDDVKRMLANAKAQEEKQRTALITNLTGIQKKLSKEQLETRSLEQLSELHEIVSAVQGVKDGMEGRSLVDFSGLGLPGDRASNPNADAQKIYLNPPDPYAASLAKLRGETPAPKPN